MLKRIVPEDAGVIIRTASEGVSEEELGRDVRRLRAQWEIIQERAGQPKTKAPQLLYGEPDLLIKVVRDLFTEDFSALIVAGRRPPSTPSATTSPTSPPTWPTGCASTSAPPTCSPSTASTSRS